MAKPLPHRWIFVIGGVVLLLFILPGNPEIVIAIEVLGTVIIGSGWFVARVVPHIHVRWDLVASTLIYAIILIVGTHFFLRWLYREICRSSVPPDSPVGKPWGFAHTLRGAAIVLLMFLVGMAAIGVAHQTAWFIAGPQPSFLIPDQRAYAIRVRCQSNLTQIYAAMTSYANQNDGRYPDDFRTLISATQYPPDILICPQSHDEKAPGPTTEEILKALAEPHHCSYLYFGKGLTYQAPAQTVLVTEPLENHRRGINVLYADKSVIWIDQPEAEQLLARLRQSFPATQPATQP